MKNARERALIPDVFDLAAGQVVRSEAEISLRSSETCRVHASVHAPRRSVPIAFRITMVMKVKDLLSAASLTFEGACATGLASTFNGLGERGRGRRQIDAVAAERRIGSELREARSSA